MTSRSTAAQHTAWALAHWSDAIDVKVVLTSATADAIIDRLDLLGLPILPKGLVHDERIARPAIRESAKYLVQKLSPLLRQAPPYERRRRTILLRSAADVWTIVDGLENSPWTKDLRGWPKTPEVVLAMACHRRTLEAASRHVQQAIRQKFPDFPDIEPAVS